jgi:iron complex outermembrane recepter protein
MNQKNALRRHRISKAFPSSNTSLRPLCLVLMLAGSASVFAQDDEEVRLAPLVVTPTRIEQSSFDLPVSIDVIDKETIQTAQPQVNTSEVLVRVPGVVANDRTNLASDLQISIRGFGARAPFGVRGIRIIADGIPLTMPDGQGQSGNIDLATARQIEVLRGPFSALYGNSSGGVINVLTEDGAEQHTVTGSAWVGDFGSSRIGLKAGGQQGSVNYVAGVARYDTDGFRDHSAATRDNFNSKLRLDINHDTSVSLVANSLSQEAQSPGSLTRAQFDADPTQSGTNPTFNTREYLENSQVGAVLSHKLTTADTVRLAGYTGTRNVEAYQNFSAPQNVNFTGGRGALGLDREFYGLDLRWTRQADLSGMPFNFTAGVNYDYMTERRNSWTNDNGVKGALGRDEDNSVFNFDQFMQAELGLTDRWSISGGVRHTSVEFESKDYFVVGANPDDSGSLKFSKTTPVLGTVFKVTPTLNIYANAGKGFETPTNVELAYASVDVSVTGMNFDLKPSTSDNYEVGVKAYVGTDTRVNAAVFKIDTKDEVALLNFFRGRSVYHNIDSTSREGFELTVDSAFGKGFTGLLAYSYINATFDNAFESCVGCTTAPNTTVPAGNSIPGIPENTVYGELAWSGVDGMSTAVEARWVDKVYVNDVNTESADAYTVVNWRLAFRQVSGGWRFTEFARVNNLFDEKYSGSVVLNDSNSAYYEPSPGRNFQVGVSVSYAF